MRKLVIPLMFMVFMILNHNVCAQVPTASSKSFRLKVVNSSQELLEKLQKENQEFQKRWEAELEAKRAALSEEQKVSEAIKIDVMPTVAIDTAEDGGTDMNLKVNFAYSTQPLEKLGMKVNISTQTDDYPAGTYLPTLSNACRLTLDFTKNKIETELLQYLHPGTKVTIKITGETDGTPVSGKLPYKGEYGDFRDKQIILNGGLNTITVTKETGITSNAQLAFLRTQGVEEFLKTFITPLQLTDNTYQIYAVENKGKGDEFRKISIELIIHGAFNEEMKKQLNIQPSPADNKDFVSDIDINIPNSAKRNDNYYALIIANENYEDPFIGDVPFAIVDGKSFAAYCEKTIGIPKDQIFCIEDGTKMKIEREIDKIVDILKVKGNKGKAIVYYSGHGYPDTKTKAAQIVPSDANHTNPKECINLNDKIYKPMGNLDSESILVVLDACFTGSKPNGTSMDEGARGVRENPREELIKGNLIVISATDSLQAAQPYRNQKHGFFTYYFLKTLQDSKGNITIGEWYEKTREIVSIESIKKYMKQTPTVNFSYDNEDKWKNIKF